MLTVNACTNADIGITSFAMIHDSFATHCNGTGALYEILRDEFRRMYQRDALMQMYAELPESAQALCGEPPARGSLDLSGVQESEYFFS